MDQLLDMQPAVYLILGIVVLIFPRILNYLVAGYLIFFGATGLWPDMFN